MGGIKLRSSSLKTYRQFSVAFPMRTRLIGLAFATPRLVQTERVRDLEVMKKR
jgi:hypothetical protein